MGTEYYLVMKDKKYKRALIVCLGKYYDGDVTHEDIKNIDNWLDEIDEILYDDSISELENIKIKDMTIKQLAGLVRIKQLLEKIKYETNIASELWKIMRVYGLVMGLIELWRSENFEWEIVSEYILFEDYIDDMRESGYDVWFWGY